MLVDHAGLGVPDAAAGGLVSFALASASASFLLARVSMVTNIERAKLDAVSCWRTVMLLAAVRARLLRAVPSRSMVVAGGGGNSMGTTQRTTPSRCLTLVLSFEVGQMEGNLPGSPCAVDGRAALPIMHLLREVLGCKDGCQGHHHKFDIRNGHANPFCLLLSILHHDNELGDAICLNVVQV